MVITRKNGVKKMTQIAQNELDRIEKSKFV